MTDQTAELRSEIARRRQVEQALLRSEQRYRMLVETMSDGLCLLDRDGQIVFVNPAFAKMLGYTPAELEGAPIRSLVDEPNRRILDANLARRRDGLRDVYELQWTRKDGRPRPTVVSAVPILADDGTFEGCFAVVADATERKRAQARRKLNEGRLEALVKLSQLTAASMQDLTDFALEEAIRLTQSQIGYLAFANEDETVLTMYSWSRAALRECRVADKPIEYKVADTGLWGEAVRQRRPIVTNDYQAPNPLKRGVPEGHVAITRHMNVPVFDGDRIVVVAGVGNKQEDYDESDVRQLTLLMDGMWKIIQRQQAEERLRAERDHSEQIVRAAPAIVCGLTLDGVATFVNPAGERITGYRADEMVGRNWWRRLYPGDDYRHVEPLVRDLQHGDVRDFETVLTSRSGEKRTVSWSSISRHDESGRRVEVIGFGNDITEARRLEVQLRHAQKMEAVGQLAGGVAHDFNNVLTAVLGNVQLAIFDLQSRLAADDPVLPQLMQAEQSALLGASVTRQLLVFSRRDAARPEVLDLNEVLTDIEPMLRSLISENIAVQVAHAPDLHGVRVDRGQMQQVILNLAVNARDAMPGGGLLKFETANVQLDESYAASHPEARVGAHVMLAASDTGCGMASDVAERVFEPFFSTKPVGQGAGLGLATVYGIVKQAGGHVFVYTEPGKGATFRVYLPTAELAPASSRPSGAAPPPSGGTETILVCEDAESVRELTAQILRDAGYTVLAAGDADRAQEAAAGHDGPLDLLVTDVIMPGMDGRSLADAIGVIRPGLKTLFVSGYTPDVIAHHNVLGPDSELLEKPFTRDQLLRHVREMLDRQTHA